MEMASLPAHAAGHDLVERVLDEFFDQARARAGKLSPRYLSLWEILQSSARGGKRVRPRILLTAYAGLGGKDLEAAARAGAAFELLHTALIIHDDVIDLDFMRRGRRNVAGAYRDRAEAAGESGDIARHRGLSAGVIAGDLALVHAFRMLETVQTDAATRFALTEILEDAMFASAGGELIDIDFSLHPAAPPVEDILHMERLKTAVYSFEAPLRAGAVLAGVDGEVTATLGKFGRDTGIAYQVVDDLLGIFGSESATGKSSLSDLREGKRTVLIAHAAQTGVWDELSGLIGDPALGPRQADRARELLESCGARAFAEDLAAEYAARARGHLECPAVPEPLRVVLCGILADAVERRR